MAFGGGAEWFDGGAGSFDDGNRGFSDYEDEYDDFGGGQAGMDQLARMGKVATANHIFSTDRVDAWRRTVRGRERALGSITNMAVANKVVIMSTNEGFILRWTPGVDLETMRVTKKADERIHKVFIDPRGNHVLFTVVSASKESPQTFYLHVQSATPEPVGKMVRANVVLDAVAWDKRGSKDVAPAENTGAFLVGTSDGTICETLFERKRSGQMHCHHFTPLMKLRLAAPKGSTIAPKPMSISGLQWERFPGENDRYFVMAAASVPPGAIKASDEPMVRFYEFVGGPTLASAFDNVAADPPFSNLPNHVQGGQLVFHHKHRGGGATSFALLSAAGIFSGQLRYGSQSQGDKVAADTTLLPLPDRSGASGGAGGAGAGRASIAGGAAMANAPIGMQMTLYHILLLYPDAVVALSRISGEVVWEDRVDAKAGMMLCMENDPTQRMVWIATDKHLFQILKKDEDRDVWKLYLEKALGETESAAMAGSRFETALQHCKTKEQKDQVLVAQADYLFAHGEHDLAAAKYARTTRSFEEVALKFINIENRPALKTFLMLKLSTLPATASTQRTILCTWLTEIFLDEMTSLQDWDEDMEMQAQYASTLRAEFKSFLSDNLQSLNETTTFHLISSHGRVPELLYYAGLVKDYERVLTHYMQLGKWETALATLRDAPEEHAEELYYKISPQLILNAPNATVRAWKKARFLDPTKLIPALVRYSQHQATLPVAARDSPNQAVIYLDYQVNTCRNRDAAIHNYLLSLLAKQDHDDDLLAFILRQTAGRKRPVFDLKYALRVCTLEGRDRACVHIYSAMGLYEEAVELALSKVDVELAKENASLPDDDDKELRKKLWLRIAHHVIEKERNVEQAIALVKQSELLKIEDVLKFFPDFVVIDEFKTEITESLNECSSRITDLKEEMKEYTESADRIRDDIKALRNRYGFVHANQKCELCDEAVLSGSFYLFPCQHSFHNSCLIKQMSKHLTRSQLDRVKTLQREIMLLDAASHNAGPKQPGQQRAATEATAQSKRDALQAELDEYVASECLFCGDIMINSVMEPFAADGTPYEDGEWDI